MIRLEKEAHKAPRPQTRDVIAQCIFAKEILEEFELRCIYLFKDISSGGVGARLVLQANSFVDMSFFSSGPGQPGVQAPGTCIRRPLAKPLGSHSAITKVLHVVVLYLAGHTLIRAGTRDGPPLFDAMAALPALISTRIIQTVLVGDDDGLTGPKPSISRNTHTQTPYASGLGGPMIAKQQGNRGDQAGSVPASHVQLEQREVY